MDDARPTIILQAVSSVDGRLELAPNMTMFDKHPAWAQLPDNSETWQKVTAAIHAAWQPGGTMMGSGTLLRESAPLKPLPPFEGDASALYTDFLPPDVVANTRHWSILVDGRGRFRSGYRGTETPGQHVLHLVSHAATPPYLAFLRRNRIPYLIGGAAHADLPAAVRKLHQRLGIRALLLWGGGILNGAMLRHGLIDEVHLIVGPYLVGGRRTPTVADCPDLGLDEAPLRLALVAAEAQADGHLWLHYRTA